MDEKRASIDVERTPLLFTVLTNPDEIDATIEREMARYVAGYTRNYEWHSFNESSNKEPDMYGYGTVETRTSNNRTTELHEVGIYVEEGGAGKKRVTAKFVDTAAIEGETEVA
jgi:hypothetical protein